MNFPHFDSRLHFRGTLAVLLGALWVFGISAGVLRTAAGAGPAKLAAAARFDVQADQQVGSLEEGKILSAEGSLARFVWLPAARQAEGYQVNVPVVHYGWTDVAVQFTPAKTGQVVVNLKGPWDQASPGELYRAEVLWGQVSASGAMLDTSPLAWTPARGWQSAPGEPPPASQQLDGVTHLRTWHDQSLNLVLNVQGGKPVTLRTKARAAVPADFIEMRPIEGRSTPAHLAAKRFRRGANIGNSLEVPPDQNWATSYGAIDFERMRGEGFDHVRIPIGWHHYTGPAPSFEVSPLFFGKVDALVDAALANHLSVLINIHHFDAFTTDPQRETDKFLALWRQIAEHYAGRPESVAFELLNEPKDAATTMTLNPIYAKAIAIIRRSNPKRTIFVGPGQWNQVQELSSLHLPDDDQNLIVTIHCYDPFFFTHQGASWAMPGAATTGILFPGPPKSPLEPAAAVAENGRALAWLDAYNNEPTERNPASRQAFAAKLRRARQWSDRYGRPVHVGEFGAYEKADAASRARYCAAFRQELDENDFGWAIWDWSAGFKYWDHATEQPVPGMRDALFGQAQGSEPEGTRSAK